MKIVLDKHDLGEAVEMLLRSRGFEVVPGQRLLLDVDNMEMAVQVTKIAKPDDGVIENAALGLMAEFEKRQK